MSLIDSILAASKTRLETRKRLQPLAELKAAAASAPRGATTLRAALRARTFSLIAEVKRKSPSAGTMDPPNVDAALDVYARTASVAAISILTDEDYFSGSIEDLRRARATTTKPLLRKDFIVDEYQIWEARAAGADAVLLMAMLHEGAPDRLARLFAVAEEVGVDVLFELGMSSVEGQELRAAAPPETIWGINSRRFATSKLQLRSRVGRLLRTELSVDARVHETLRPLVPSGSLAVAESGIHDPDALGGLFALSYNAALIGTAFLKVGVRVASEVRRFDDAVARVSGSKENGKLEVDVVR